MFVGNGFGGGSLVNVNVFLECMLEVFEMNVWFKELRGKEKWRKCMFFFEIVFCCFCYNYLLMCIRL